MSINALVFDLGQVLLAYNPDLTLKKFCKTEQDLEAAKRFLNPYVFLADGGCSYELLSQIVLTTEPEFYELICFWAENWEDSIPNAIAENVRILEELARQSIPLYALSNFSQEKFSSIYHKYAFLELFDKIIISGAVQQIKPFPAIYEILFTESKRSASELLFIDDNQKNIATAIELGMQGIVYKEGLDLRKSLQKYLPVF